MNSTLRKLIGLDGASDASHRLPPVAAADAAPELGRLVLLTRDADALTWGPRWLGFAGFSVIVADDLEAALEETAKAGDCLAIVDAAVTDDAGRAAWLRLKNESPKGTPVFALCHSAKEVRDVTQGGKADVLRRPFNWERIAQRVRREAEANALRAKLARTTRALKLARLDAADAERHLAAMRGVDTLTGLPNRDLFRSLLHRAISGSLRGETMGVLVAGIDRFARVNATLGHEAGNRVICQFAERLRCLLKDRSIVGGDSGTTLTAAGGRIGGVRFGIVLSRAGMDDIVRLRDAVLADLERPFEVDGQSVYLSATMGAALFPSDANTSDELLECAEHAMCTAKSRSSSFRFFDRDTDAAGRRLLRMESMLREALATNQLRLAYQPIMRRDGHCVVAAEALLRWDHPEEGPISPAEFVPAAERSGLMLRIGEFVLREAVRQLRAWQDEGREPVRMAVNLSRCQLADGNVVELVRELLDRYEINPVLLEFELSERGVLNSGEGIVSVVRELKALGVRISIDDFGAGNSSVSYLKDLPADVIKIDRSYVSGPKRSARDEAIGSGMVALAKRLNADVVAEGVEDRRQLESVREWGCDEIQGFLFSAAVAPADFAELLPTRRRAGDAARQADAVPRAGALEAC